MSVFSFFLNRNLPPRTEGNMVESQVRFFKMFNIKGLSLVVISNFQMSAQNIRLYFIIIDHMIIMDLGIGMVNKLNTEGDINSFSVSVKTK